MNHDEQNQTPDAERRIWADIGRINKNYRSNQLKLGQLFRELGNLYSERNSGGVRRTSGHGTFEEEIQKRGYKPRRVREWIMDFEVSEGLRQPTESTAAKRKARRSNSDEYQRGYRAAIRSTHASLDTDPVTRFAALLPFSALKSAFRTALQELHPDHGGSEERTKELIRAWEEVEALHSSAAAQADVTSAVVH